MQFLATATFVASAILGAHAQSTIEDTLSQSYAPIYVDCPADIEWIRPATSLSCEETTWVHKKKKNVLCALETYLENLSLEDFDLPNWVAHMLRSNYTDVPTLSMAISGGGYASAFTGVGAFRAFDSRLDAANDAKTGGLLQSMTYITGQSGGSWPVIGLSTFNFPTVDKLVFDHWKPWIDRLDNTDNTSTNAGTPESLFEDVAAKAEAGFDVGVADYFGRAYGYEFLPGANGGLGFTYSNITSQSNFINHHMPFPMLLTTALDNQDTEYFGLAVPYSNSTIYEMTPWEFGNWDGPVPGFTPMEYIGTILENGTAVNESTCVRGFDRASYIIGTAASAFNFWVIEAESNNTEAPFSKAKRSPSSTLAPRTVTFPEAEIDDLVEAFQEYFNLNLTDIVYAAWPNPFAGLPSPSTATTPPENLNLVDTSEVGQGLPLWPLIQSVRNPSLIFAWEDNGGDAAPYSWTNGTNLYDAYIAANASGLAFPIVPPATTMLNLNMTVQPTFFGCNTSLTTSPNTTDSPIILYLANAPYSAYTNISWTQTATSSAQMWEILVNSFDLVTAGNGTLDSEWPACIGCAVIERSLEGAGLQRSSQCGRCFDRYCWNGTYDDSPAGILDPSLRLNPGLGFVEWNLTNPFTDTD